MPTVEGMKLCLFALVLIAGSYIPATAATSAADSPEMPEISPRISAESIRRAPAPELAAPPAAEDQTDDGPEGQEGPADDVIPADDPRLGSHELEGLASWYGGKFQGRLTANGEVFDTNELTAAHKTLPFNSIVRVVNQSNGKSVEVRINDRGPFVEGRVIDLSRAGAGAIGMSGSGVAPVRLDVLHFQTESPYRVLQIGAFGDRDNAEQLHLELSNAGLEPEIRATDTGIYRLLIPKVHIDQLEDIRATLAQLGYPDVLVRKN